MCKECFINAGSPVIQNEKVTKAVELVEELYDSEDGGAGGYAHIVTDDWNLDDGDVKGCLNDAIEGKYKHVCEETREICIRLLNHFLTMTEDERYSALGMRSRF